MFISLHEQNFVTICQILLLEKIIFSQVKLKTDKAPDLRQLQLLSLYVNERYLFLFYLF